jgi:hypothetical protein
MPLGAFKFATFSVGDADGPVWTTSAGSLGTRRPGIAISGQTGGNFSLAAADEAGNGENFSVTIGSLPGGLTLTDNGDGTATIAGTPNTVTSSTTSTFTVTAEDDNGNGTDREFSITIEPNYYGDGSDGAFNDGND